MVCRIQIGQIKEWVGVEEMEALSPFEKFDCEGKIDTKLNRTSSHHEQQRQYPMQPTCPVQPPGNPVYPQTLHIPHAPPYTDAPPAYSELYRPNFVHPGTATVPTTSAALPGASLYPPIAQSVAVGPLSSTIPMAYYPVGPIYPPDSAVLVEGGYNASARFGAGATAGNIPCPPPGCPPNAAQLAVMQGANVLITQRKGNFFTDGSDGGYTIW
nr:DAZ-associated protein 2-like [Mirounga angustirostris]